MIIAVDDSTAQYLHINARTPHKNLTNDELSWSVRTTGDFMIIMNNGLALPVIVRHPQRFNDSRSFVAAFKREFLSLLEVAAIPHAKIRLLRDDQFSKVHFTNKISGRTSQQLDQYQQILDNPVDVIDWEEQPTNVRIAHQLAEETTVEDTDLTVMDVLEQYVMMNYHLPAHPQLNEHNRSYLYRSTSLNDIMNAVAVNQHFIQDYRNHLSRASQSDEVIDRNTDVATDYCSYCEALGVSPLDDLTFPYYYLLHYQENSDEGISDGRLRDIAVALRDFAQFMCVQKLFSNGDFEQFAQAIEQGRSDLYLKQDRYQLQNVFDRLQLRLDKRWQSLAAPRRYARKCFTVEVQLADYRPKMWRKFMVGGDTRLDKFCMQVLALFKVRGNHLFELTDGTNVYQLPQMGNGIAKTTNLTDHWLGDYQVGDHFTLEYDFGDSWEFNIRLVDRTTWSWRQNDGHAHLCAGFGSGIIEDIGGPRGLTRAAKDDQSINRQLDVNECQERWGTMINHLQQRYQ